MKRRLSKLGLDGLLVTRGSDVRYLSGFTGHDSIVLVTHGRQHFITDSRYLLEARETVKGFSIKLVTESTYTTIADIVKSSRLKRLGFEPMQMPHGVYLKLSKAVPGTRLIDARDIVGDMRQVKEPAEVALIRRSVSLTKSVFRGALSMLKPGASESMIARHISAGFVKAGAAEAFEPIVASGESSSRPHYRAGERKVRRDSFVMIDLGARRDGYCSDLTRTVLTGAVSDRFAMLYRTVRDAQRRAIDNIRDGARISAADFAARGHISSKGFGRYFGHSTGHGVGLDIHEGPTVSRGNGAFFRAGMVVTVEPAIYLPGFGGVRIEDMVLVTDDGCEILT